MGIHGRMGSSVGYSHDMAQQKPSSWDITGCDGKNGKVNIEDPASLLDLSFQQARSCHVFFLISFQLDEMEEEGRIFSWGHRLLLHVPRTSPMQMMGYAFGESM